MTSTNSTIALPAFVQAILDDSDQAETLTLPDLEIEGLEVTAGAVTIARAGRLSVRIKHNDREVAWHEHEDEDSAVECYTRDVAFISERVAYVANGGDPLVLAISANVGVPLEIAEMMVPQVRAQLQGEPNIPVPAVGRAPVPPQVVTVSDEYDFTGFYL